MVWLPPGKLLHGKDTDAKENRKVFDRQGGCGPVLVVNQDIHVSEVCRLFGDEFDSRSGKRKLSPCAF